MTSMTMAQWQAVITQQAADFQAANKYKIAGKPDFVFQNVAQGIHTDATFDALKQLRIAEMRNIAGINRSTADADTKQKLVAQARLPFLQQSLRGLQAVEQTGNAASIVKAVRELSTELSNAVSSYTAAMGQVQDSARDPAFIAAAGKVADGLKALLAMEAPRLQGQNIFYSVDSVQSLKLLNSIKTMLAHPVQPSPAPAPAVAAAPTTPGGVDVSI